MLEYLSQRKVFYSYYPQVELQDLREENALLQNYREVAHGIMCSDGVSYEDILRLPRKNLLSLIDDSVICSGIVLTDLLIAATESREMDRILYRMRTWEGFDWGYLEDTLSEMSGQLPSWYQPALEICTERNQQ